MRKTLFTIGLILAGTGCNSQDVATLGRIGKNAQAKLSATFGDDTNTVINALPINPPTGSGKKNIGAE